MTRAVSTVLGLLIVAESGVLVFASPSIAGPWGSSSTSQDKQHPSQPNILQSQVSYSLSYTGAGPRMTAAAGSNWSPPVCWYEPEFTPEAFANYINSNYRDSSSAWGTMGDDYGADDFPQG